MKSTSGRLIRADRTHNKLTGCFFVLFLMLIHTLSAQQTPTQLYIEKYKELAIREMNLYRIPASITLAQGILESGSGKSELAINARNHFGIKCKTEWTGEKYYYDDDEKQECFRKYARDEDSYRDHSLFLTTRERYSSLFRLDITDYRAWAKGLKEAGYATSPVYAESLIKIIEDNALYLLDKPEGKLPVPSPSDTVATKPVIKKPNKQVGSDFDDIVLQEGERQVFTTNGVMYIIANSSDTPAILASIFGLSVHDIYRFNDLNKNERLTAGERVYLARKKKKATVPVHIVKQGESLRGISQLYAVSLKWILKYNNLDINDQPATGQVIRLK